ncbi:MAG: hypothetical protein QOH81_2560 [Sphingomonadales bacterium]|jgi:ornithine cyclodeaminase/alanine dehydrogenase-like protein (mu-crystallin family)|nr:hypothetical protein [Sphingomonadales bacterium]
MAQAPDTLILSRREIADLMTPADYLTAVEAAFCATAEGRGHAPPPLTLGGAGGAFHAKAATIRLDRLYAALKFNGNFPSNPPRWGLPTIQGAILLCDGETGSLLAILDSAEVTLRRTAAATALAARFLARPESKTLLICGCGAQAPAQFAALADILPLDRCLLWDANPPKAEALASSLAGAEAAANLGEAAAQADIIVTCTTTHRPFLDATMVRAGTFVAAVGADGPEKNEITPALMAKATVVADVLDQCVTMGDLRHALAAGSMRREDVHAELAELVVRAKSGRRTEEEITLFDSTGTALQDVAAAAALYERARRSPNRLSVALAA